MAILQLDLKPGNKRELKEKKDLEAEKCCTDFFSIFSAFT